MISSVRLHDENYSDDFNKITDDSLGKQFKKNIEKKLGRNSPYLLLITNLVKQLCNLDYGGRPRLPDIIKSLEEIANIVDPKFLESSDKKIKKNKKCNIF